MLRAARGRRGGRGQRRAAVQALADAAAAAARAALALQLYPTTDQQHHGVTRRYVTIRNVLQPRSNNGQARAQILLPLLTLYIYFDSTLLFIQLT